MPSKTADVATEMAEIFGLINPKIPNPQNPENTAGRIKNIGVKKLL